MHIIENAQHNKDAIFIVVAGFIANFMVFGISFTFGVFQEYYTSSEGPLTTSPHAVVALIGTVASATTYICAVFYTTLLKWLRKPRYIMILGSVLMSLGLLLGSIVQEKHGEKNLIYQYILSQGLLFGIGASMVYIPPVVCAPPYFTRHRGIALGILFSGTGIGALVLAPVSRLLLANLGWRWALRILGLINLAVTFISSFMVQQHPSLMENNNNNNDKSFFKQMFDYKAVDLISLLTQLGAGFFQSAGYLICLNYMSTYSETLGFSAQQGANFIAINNGINALFKILIGHLADKTGRLNMIIICNLLSAISVLTLWMISTRATFISFIVLYGIVSGAIISLLPTCLSEIFGIKNYQSISGLMYFFRGIGNFLGSPIAGVLIKHDGKVSRDYQNAIIYNGVLLLSSTILLFYLKIRVVNGLIEKQNI